MPPKPGRKYRESLRAKLPIDKHALICYYGIGTILDNEPMSTIRDVAKLAGVAPITVSRVINNSGYITDETRQRVEEAIRTLGYMPNSLARSLRSHQTRMLALVLTDITNPFWTTVARGVEDAASDAGFSVILCNTDESDLKQERYIRVILEKRVDGVLLVPSGNPQEPVCTIRSQRAPVVVLDRRVSGELGVDSVRSDSIGGARDLVRLLIRLGHKRIATLTGPRDVSTAIDRVTGYREALKEAGLTWEQVLYGEYDLASGYSLVNEALQSESPQVYGEQDLASGYKLTGPAQQSNGRPTAFFAANNFLAIGALRALRAANLQVPEQVALVGFDDLPEALMVDPFLTVAAQPAYEMGHKATELLLERLAGHAPDGCQEIVLPTQLIIRRSSGGSIR